MTFVQRTLALEQVHVQLPVQTEAQLLETTAVKARFQTLGPEAIPSTPAQMAAYAKSEREKWGQLIRTSNIRLD